MKIKNDFITNSSSTSYVVCIPDNFKFELNNEKIIGSENYDIIEFDDFEGDFETEGFDERVILELNKMLDSLRQGGDVFNWGEYGYSPIMSTLIQALPDKYVMQKIDSGSDRGGVWGIKKSKIVEVLNEDKG